MLITLGAWVVNAQSIMTSATKFSLGSCTARRRRQKYLRKNTT